MSAGWPLTLPTWIVLRAPAVHGVSKIRKKTLQSTLADTWSGREPTYGHTDKKVCHTDFCSQNTVFKLIQVCFKFYSVFWSLT